MKFAALLFALLCVPAWAQNTVTVRVADADKKPLAGATVALRIWGEQPCREETLKAGDDGEVKFDLAKPLDPEKPVGSVTAYASGFVLQSHAIDAATLEFALKPGVVWNGVVVDETDKPIEGAKIVIGILWEKGASRDDYLLPIGQGVQEVYSAQSDAEGRFSIANIPVGGKFSYSATAPKMATVQAQDVNAVQAARVVLKPGALFSGQVRQPDGTPLPKMRVYASSTNRFSGGGFGEEQTDAEGRFVIDNLSAGTYNVGADVPEGADYLIPPQQNLLAEIGQTKEVPTVQAVAGLLVKGIVRDAETHKPLAGARIAGIFGPDGGGDIRNQSEVTGPDGRFSLRVLPGQNTFQVNRTLDDYISSGIQQTLVIGEKTPDLTIDLPQQPILTGTIVDEKNQPIAARLRVWGGFQQEIVSDAQGQWSYKPEALGKVEVAGGDGEDGYFEISSGGPLAVPSKRPQTVKVRRKPWQTLSGRVVAPDGTPRAGIEVKASFYVSVAGDGGGLLNSDLTATTGADGVYTFSKIRGGEQPGEMVRGLKVTTSAGGYAFAGGGEIARDGASWRASDIVLNARGRQIEGVTAPNARVAAAGQSARAAADGKFSLKDLPTGQTTVYAALDGKFGSARVADEGPVTIELEPLEAQNTDVGMGRDVWREVVDESQDKNFYARSWVIGRLNAAQSETFAALQASAKEPPTPDHDWSLYTQLQKWAPRLGADSRVEQIESVARGIEGTETRLTAWLDVAIAVGDDKAVAERALREAQEVTARAATDVNQREYNLYRVAVVTENARGPQAGAAALDRAIAVTLQSHGPKNFIQGGSYVTGRDGTLARMAETVAQGSDELLRRLLVNIAPEAGDDAAALGTAIPVVARTYGVEAALPLLEKLRALPEPNFAPEDSHVRQNEPRFAFDVAARRVVPLLGAKDPARALELARRIEDKGGRARALASVASFQTPEIAAQAWREAVTIGDIGDTPRFAAQAFESDAKLGRELFELARIRGENSESYDRSGFWAPFAFYLARADAATARLELEREWSARLTSNEGQSLAPIARAMSAVDGTRALEMARQIPAGKGNFWSLEARRKIGQYLVASEAERRDWPFDRWGATDTWQPGDEEW